MKIDIVEMSENDVMMIHHNIGNLPTVEADKHCEKATDRLTNVFGKGHILLFPVREGPEWDFTIVRRQV